MAAGVKVTEKKFKAIKILLESGETYENIAESMGVSKRVVGVVRSSETFEEYRHKIYLSSPTYRKKRDAALKAEQERKEREAAEKVNEEQPPAPEEKKPEPQVVEHRQVVTVQATHYMMEEMKKTNELLTLISNKLAFIVDELTGVK